MKGKRLQLIYNLNAGRRKLTGQLDTVIRIFQKSSYEVCIQRGSSPQDIEPIASQSSEVEGVVIAGGDGAASI